MALQSCAKFFEKFVILILNPNITYQGINTLPDTFFQQKLNNCNSAYHILHSVLQSTFELVLAATNAECHLMQSNTDLTHPVFQLLSVHQPVQIVSRNPF